MRSKHLLFQAAAVALMGGFAFTHPATAEGSTSGSCEFCIPLIQCDPWELHYYCQATCLAPVYQCASGGGICQPGEMAVLCDE